MSATAVQTVDDVLDQLTGFWRSAILRAAFDLNIPDHIANGRCQPASIAAAEHADPRGIGVLLESLAALGMLSRTAQGYRLAPVVEMMLPAFGSSTASVLNQHTWDIWGRLSEAVRSGTPVGESPEYWIDFARGTREISLTQGMGAIPLVALPPGTGARVLDVGCGSGGVGFAFALADPTVTTTGFDSADVLAVAAEYADRLGIASRVSLWPADIVAAETFGDAEFDVVVAANLLHLFDPATNRVLLRKIAAALVPGGRLFVNDIVPDEQRSDAFAVMFAAEMLLRTPGGSSYTAAEISEWLAEAGFEQIAAHPMMGHMTAIIGTRRKEARDMRYLH
jgi:2-polyprenyl-3-methyl-5-hydroxy-6-metoxy-1,4-benzoquinol methylase